MRCRYILRGHTGIVHCLWVKGNRLYSGGGTRDKWVRVSENIQCTHHYKYLIYDQRQIWILPAAGAEESER